MIVFAFMQMSEVFKIKEYCNCLKVKIVLVLNVFSPFLQSDLF